MAVRDQNLDEMIISSWNVAMQKGHNSGAMSKLDEYMDDNVSLTYKEEKYQNISKKEKAISVGHKFMAGGLIAGALMIFEIGLWPITAFCVGVAGISYFFGSSLGPRLWNKIGEKFLWRFFNKRKYVEKSKAKVYAKVKSELAMCRNALKENESLLKGKVDVKTMSVYLQNRVNIVNSMAKECRAELGKLRKFTEKTGYNYSSSKEFYNDCYKMINGCVEPEKINLEVFEEIKANYMDSTKEKGNGLIISDKDKNKGNYEYFSANKNLSNKNISDGKSSDNNKEDVVDEEFERMVRENRAKAMSEGIKQLSEEIDKMLNERKSHTRMF